MKSKNKKNLGKLNKFFRFIAIFFIFTNSLLVIINIPSIEIIKASENDLEWSVTLNFNETDGANNNVFFGEALDASDGQDSYDVPIPPPGIAPYIRTWFDAGLNEPYNSLLYDVRIYPDNLKIWDLYVQWVPSDYTSSNYITISWELSEIASSEYESVVLFDYENDIIVADMQADNSYTYSSQAMVQYHYQIICNSSTIPNNPPFQPSNPSPQDGAIDVDVDKILTWIGGDPDEGDEVKYDVYFGKTSSPPKVSTNQSSTAYDHGILSYNTKYYWKIVTWDEHGLSNEGLVWHFTTVPQISPDKNLFPTAKIRVPKISYVNQTITFDGSESNDLDGYVEYYRWDFTDDGKWDTYWIEEAVISYIYIDSGNYTIKLQIKDNGGLIDTATTTIEILLLQEDKLMPIALANGPYLGIINKNITFDASGSYDPDGIISNYTWDFGSSSKKYEKITTYIYKTAGTYPVTLTVVDNDGLMDIDTTYVYVYNNDSDGDGWGDEEERKYGSDPYNLDDFPLDTDKDHIPDLIDDNDDNDGLSDKLEEKLGSDPKNKSDVFGIIIKDVIHFLIDTDNDGKSELFYNSRSGNVTDVEYKGDNRYLLDENGDGKWDYVYDYVLGTISPYKKDERSYFQIELLIIVILIVLFLIIITFRFFYKKD